MRLHFSVLVLAALLFTPQASRAEPFHLYADYWSGGALFNADGFSGASHLDLFEGMPSTMTITAGPLLSLVIDTTAPASPLEPWARYRYGAGELRVSTALGDFVAVLPGFEFAVKQEDVPPGTWWGDVYWDSKNALGSGTFDPALAAFLGVGTKSSGGTFWLIGDVWSPLPGHDDFSNGALEDRFVFFSATNLDIDARVPEPGAVMLLLTAGIGYTMRRRRSYRANLD